MWYKVHFVILIKILILRKFDIDAMRLPLIQISHDDFGEDYPEAREEVHLEDFFWTGSGDGPPDFLKKVHTGISKGKDVIVKTETVVATVYVDGNNEVDIPLCVDCVPDDMGRGGGGIWDYGSVQPPLNYSATDRRYWLLTVMSGFYSQKDNPALEEKLARLYRLAFTRQQSKHLGLNGLQQISGISLAAGRDRREHRVENTPHSLAPNLDVEVLNVIRDGVVVANSTFPTARGKSSEWRTSSESEEESEEEKETDLLISSTTESHTTESAIDRTIESTNESPYVTIIPWELIQEGAKFEKQISAEVINSKLPPSLRVQHALLQPDSVRVVIHNVTHLTEEDLQRSIANGLYDEDVNDKIDERPIANQTELIYSVFVNGRPVLAVTAANDMKLVSEDEVSEAIGKEIFMKAEPYLREPQATPLAPATHSGNVGFIDSIQNNPALVIVSSVALLLLLLLLVALLLMGRSRSREKHREELRTSSRNEFLSDNQSGRATSSGTMIETGRSTAQSRDNGIQNLSFESEGNHSTRTPRIHYPPPPQDTPRRGSITSSDNTSDSSVYSPINPPTADVQRMLDEKAASLFDKPRRRHHQYDRPEGRTDPVYTSVLSEKKRDKNRYKNRRRYLSENRVGSLETSPTQRPNHSSAEDALTDIDGEVGDEGLQRAYANFERAEAYNPNTNYHRNKLLHQNSVLYVDKEYSNVHDEEMHTTEAINKEIIKALQPSERSSDTGSIGSFLSMASVRAFPKNALPEPLNRVLDPVFVTYYDNVDESQGATAKQQRPSSAKSRKSTGKQRNDTLDSTTAIATIDSFPTPKAPVKAIHLASQSDNPDPGVLGPVVWERHKKRLNDESETDIFIHGDYSPVRDPAAMRYHYEGLLEGAMQMYSSQDDLPMPLPTNNFNKRRISKRLNLRGSSADALSHASRALNGHGRPATAQPEKTPKSNHSTEPPSPTTSAWGGSLHGSDSTLRPLSSGPFHRPEVPFRLNDSSPRPASLTAAPIIEAIQNELRRFKENTK